MTRKSTTKKKKDSHGSSGNRQPSVQLPKEALSRVNLGQAFAEYDLIRTNPYLFVRTPALLSALDPERSKSFYVGRRGTGKTAITFAIEQSGGQCCRIYPELFSPLSDVLRELDFANTHQQPFRSLIAAFRRALQGEILKLSLPYGHSTSPDLPPNLRSELRLLHDLDFDRSVLAFLNPLLASRLFTSAAFKTRYRHHRPR